MVVSEMDGQFQRFLSVVLWSYLCNCCRGFLPTNAALPCSRHRHALNKTCCVLCHLFGPKSFCAIRPHKLLYHNLCQSDFFFFFFSDCLGGAFLPAPWHSGSTLLPMSDLQIRAGLGYILSGPCFFCCPA